MMQATLHVEPAMAALPAEQEDEQARLNARVPGKVYKQIKRAAAINGVTITDFVLSAAIEAAQRTVEQANVMRLSLADQECFAAALLDPPKPNAALQRALTRRTQLLREE